MKILGFISLLLTFIVLPKVAHAQNSLITGTVTDTDGNRVEYASVIVNRDSVFVKGTTTDSAGNYKITVHPGNYQLKVKSVGYKEVYKPVKISDNQVIRIDITLREAIHQMNEMVIDVESEEEKIKKSGYDVNILETKKVENRNINVNQLITQSVGVRVRESGGLGSSFSYSLNGMSGRAIRFYVDGVPVDRYGAGYSINNFPVNLIDRIEIYKGVVPASFGGDALGGVVNLISKTGYNKYIDASYSMGSFGTHRYALATRWADKKTGVYALAQGYYNKSLNNYYVYGDGVEVANPTTGRAEEIKTKRFHDAFESYAGRFELGLQNKKWADKVAFSLLLSNYDKEIQHGATMAKVFGEAKRFENSWSPSIQYKKKDFLIDGLEIMAYSSYSNLETKLVDTSSRIYDWSGKVIDEGPTYSELGFGSNGKSLLTLNSENYFNQGTLKYSINDTNNITFSYTYDFTERVGNDPLEGDRTAGFRAPQDIAKQVAALAYENRPSKKLTNTIWVKNYDFKANSVDQVYITDSLGYRPIEVPVSGATNNWGYGAAIKYEFFKNRILKFSFENAYRLPDVQELLGDGILVKNNPNLLPEQSYNINTSILISDVTLSENYRLTIEPALFYRDVNNLILYIIQSTRGTGTNQNIGEVIAKGVSTDLSVRYKNKLEVKGNITYQDIRDNRKYIGPNVNATYKDRLRNTPYLMANAGIYYTEDSFFKNKLSVFWDVQYVNEFFLNWPSLGLKSSKAVIPTQLINNTGITYSLKGGKYNISAECNNIFNEQVYDNYLIQKPGRSYSIKLRLYLSNKINN